MMQMAEVGLATLDDRLQKHVEKAIKAIENGNLDYAVDICGSVLKRHPECLEVRRVLRKAQLQSTRGKGRSMPGIFSRMRTVPFLLKCRPLIRKDPRKVIESADRLLTENPADTIALGILAQASEAMGLRETMVFALETIRIHEPNSIANLLALGQGYMKLNRAEEAIRVGESVLRRDPANGEAQELIKNASVSQSINKGGWDVGGDYRSESQGGKAGVGQEESGRITDDDAHLMRRLEGLKQSLKDDPGNISQHREIIRLYERLGRLDEAIHWLRKAQDTPLGLNDPALERVEIELTLCQYHERITEKEKSLERAPHDAVLKNELDQAKEQLRYYQSNTTRELVEKYPNDQDLCFEYGVLLFQNEKFREVAKQFQIVSDSPKLRLRALLNLGRSFRMDMKLDLAVVQLNKAKSEHALWDDLKKEILYELAVCFEGMGKSEDALSQYKQIYTVDVDYRDIADKVNSYYRDLGDS